MTGDLWKRSLLVCASAFGLGVASCGDDGPELPRQRTSGDTQSPPTGAANIDAWLAAGHYRSWHCELMTHEPRPPSPHGVNRVCQNDIANAHGAGEYPVGAVNVKEIHDAAGGVVGYALSHKVAPGPDGATWYWYERLPGVGAVVDGLGTAGSPQQGCVDCHAAAGSDAEHSGHDFVYTQVR